MNNDRMILNGVVKSHNRETFVVKTDSHEVKCKISGNIRRFQIKISEGDSVSVEVSPLDLSSGRIVRRLK
jgi:translation initiation factor IF-1